MKNKLFRVFTIVLLTLTFSAHNHFHFEVPTFTELEVNVCALDGVEDPFEDEGDDDPLSP